MKNIFISSTFRDMHAERDFVVEKVLPAIRGEAKKYGTDVGVKDLRWGVDTSTLNSKQGAMKVLDVCFDEIDKSRPYMLIFVGDRYGWVPDIETTYKALKKRKGYFSLLDLRKSVTELEIKYGALKKRNVDTTKCVVCIRKSIDTYDLSQAERVVYREEKKKLVRKLNSLKRRIKNTFKNNVIEYTYDWDSTERKMINFRCVDGTSLEAKLAEKFALIFKDEWEKYAAVPWIVREQKYADALVDTMNARFDGREQLLRSYFELVKENNALMLRGETGVGKTSVLCKMISKFEAEGYKVFKFFARNTMVSWTEYDLLKQMVNWLELELNKKCDDYEKDYSMNDLKKRLESLCAEVSEDEKIIFCIDGVEQLYFGNECKELSFISESIRNVKIVFTVYDEFHIKKRLEGVKEETIDCLKNHDSKENVVNGLFRGNSRDSYKEVVGAMMQKKESGRPCYLSMLVQRLVMMNQQELFVLKSEKDIIARCVNVVEKFPDNYEDAIEAVLDYAISRVSVRKETLVEVLRWLAISRGGLREEDLRALIEMQGNVFSSIDFTYLMKYLDNLFVIRENGRIDFANRSIRKAILKNMKSNFDYDRAMFSYLISLPEIDDVRNSQIVYFAWLCDENDFIEQFIYENAENINEMAKYSLLEIGLQDEGELYCEILRKKSNIKKLKYLVSVLMNLLRMYDKNIASALVCKNIYLQIYDLYENELLVWNEDEYAWLVSCINGSMEELGEVKESVKFMENVSEKVRKMLEIESCTLSTYIKIMYMAAICFDDANDCEKAIWAYKNVIKYFHEMAEIQKNINMLSRYEEVQLETFLAKSFLNVGMLLKVKANDDKKALANLEIASMLFENIPRTDKEISFTYKELGRIYDENGNPDKAMEYYHFALKKATDIYEKDKQVDEWCNILIINAFMGKALLNSKKDREGARKFEWCEYECKKLERDNTKEIKGTLVVVYHLLGEYHFHFKRYEDAIEYYLKAISINKFLYTRYGSRVNKDNFFVIYRSLITLYSTINDYENRSKYQKLLDELDV